MKSRIPLPEPTLLTPQGRAVYDSIVATRGNVAGPFLAWLHAPAFAGLAEKLGAYCRYDTSLSRQEAELLILTVAARHRCDGEWRIHAPIALEAGLSEQTLAMLQAGRRPEFADSRLATLHRFADELVRTNRVSTEAFTAAETELGVHALVEAVGLLGYYALVAMTLNAFEMDPGGDPIF
jgi:4-carboxymuconolactone decarboxylase